MAKPLISKNNLNVGKNTYYNGNIFIKGRGQINIGSYLAIGDNLRILAGNNHNYSYPVMQVSFYRQFFSKYPGALPDKGVTIGSDVWFGDNVTVLDGSVIGDGCCVAAGAVVKGQFSPYSIIGGIPAKVIKQRFSESTINILLKIKWWTWDDEKIKRNKIFFHTDLSNLSEHQIEKILQD